MIWFIMALAGVLAWIVLRQYKFIQASLKTVEALMKRCVFLWKALKAAEKRVEDLQKVEVENEHLRLVIDKWKTAPIIKTDELGFTHGQVLGGWS